MFSKRIQNAINKNKNMLARVDSDTIFFNKHILTQSEWYEINKILEKYKVKIISIGVDAYNNLWIDYSEVD
jgi:5'(3')-deoxyribonucleotidase